MLLFFIFPSTAGLMKTTHPHRSVQGFCNAHMAMGTHNMITFLQGCMPAHAPHFDNSTVAHKGLYVNVKMAG